VPAGNLAAAVGADGGLRAVWQEESTPGASRVVLRALGAQGWGPPVAFPTKSVNQINPSVAVAPDGTAHVVWDERIPDRSIFEQRFMHAAVAPGAAAAGDAERVGDEAIDRQKIDVAALADGTLCVVYGTDRDVYFREKAPGGSWSPALNVSRLSRHVSPYALRLLAAPSGDLSVVWLTGAQSLQVMGARREAGFWLATTAIGPAAPHLFDPTAALGPHGDLHVTWTGANPAGSDDALSYLMLPGSGTASGGADAPVVLAESPKPQGWIRDDTATVAARVLAGSAVAASDVSVTIDGQPVPATLASDGTLQAKAEGLSDGSHAVRVDVTDARQQRGFAEWTFKRDSQPPALGFEATADGAPLNATEGWLREPVVLRSRAAPDDGAPAWTEWSADRSGLWTNASAASAAAPASPVEPLGQGAIRVREGLQPALRFRAVDAAGNVALGPEVRLGWDAHAPAVDLPWPTWVSPGHRLAANDTAPAGSPVSLHLRFTAADGTVQAYDGPLADAAVPALADGAHDASGWAEDAAGNRQDLAAGRVQVDRAPPEVRVDGSGLSAQDAGSGLATLRATAPDGTVLAEQDLAGAPSASLDVSGFPALWRATVTDAAGNAVDAGPGAAALASATGGASPGAAAIHRRSPAAAPEVLAVALVALAALSRRRA
jgi:hypothetical protein